MMRHIALLQWRQGTSDAQIAAAEKALTRMPEVMPFIRRYDIGRDLGVNGSHHFAVVADFDSVDDYRAYADNDEHRRVIAELIAPMMESIARVQFNL